MNNVGRYTHTSSFVLYLFFMIRFHCFINISFIFCLMEFEKLLCIIKLFNVLSTENVLEKAEWFPQQTLT